MAENIVLSFAFLFGAVIALICAVYAFLIMRRNQALKLTELEEEEVPELEDFNNN